MPEKRSPAEPAKGRPSAVARWLAVAISATFAILGGLAIATQHYYGRTTKPGRAEIVVEGQPAVIMGIGLILIGMTPLALWARTGKGAGWWAACCMLTGVGLLLGAPLIAR